MSELQAHTRTLTSEVAGAQKQRSQLLDSLKRLGVLVRLRVVVVVTCSLHVTCRALASTMVCTAFKKHESPGPQNPHLIMPLTTLLSVHPEPQQDTLWDVCLRASSCHPPAQARRQPPCLLTSPCAG